MCVYKQDNNTTEISNKETMGRVWITSFSINKAFLVESYNTDTRRKLKTENPTLKDKR